MVLVTMLAANIGAGSTVGATGLALPARALGLVVVGLRRDRLPRPGALGGPADAPPGRRATASSRSGDFLEWRFDRSVRVLIAGGAVARHARAAGRAAHRHGVGLRGDRGLPRVAGALLSALMLVLYFSGGGLLASAWVNLLQLVTLLVGLPPRDSVRVVGGRGMGGAARRGRSGGGAAPTGASRGWGWRASSASLVVFVPSFFVSPGLIQKTFGARSPSAARWAALGNALALALFAFVPALLGMAMRAVEPGLANPELALPRLTDRRPAALGGRARPGRALRGRGLDRGRGAVHAGDVAQPRPLPGRPAAEGDGRGAAARGAPGRGGAGERWASCWPWSCPRCFGPQALLRGPDRRALHAARGRASCPAVRGPRTRGWRSRPPLVATGGLRLALAGTPLGAWLPSVAGVGRPASCSRRPGWRQKDERPGGGARPPAGPGAA